MDSTTIIIVIGVLLFDLFFVTIIMRKKKASRERTAAFLVAASSQEGWQMLPGAPNQIYRIEGKMSSGIRWELTSQRRKKSAQRPQRTVWQTEDVRLEGGVIAICSGMSIQSADVDLNHPLIKLALQRLFSPKPAAALAEAKVILFPESDVARHHMIFSSNEELAREFMRDPLPSILEEWRRAKMPTPNMILWSGGMQVRFTQSLEDVEAIRKAVTLCEGLAVRAKDVANKG